jgi:hypothetical protein
MENKNRKPRERNVAHFWVDKRIIRAFRKGQKKNYKNYRNVYLALCEIDSDFSQRKHKGKVAIHSLTKTAATYSGVNSNIVSKCIQQFRDWGIIDYGRIYNNQHQTIGSYLILFEIIEEDLRVINPQKDKKEDDFYIIDSYNIEPDNDLRNNNIIDNKNSSKEEIKEKKDPLFEKENKKPLLRVTQPIKEFTTWFMNEQNKRQPIILKKKDIPKRIDDSCQFLMRFKKEYDFETVIKPALTFALTDNFWRDNIYSFCGLKKKNDSGDTKFENILKHWEREKAGKSHKPYSPATQEDRLKNEKNIAWHI